MANKISILEMRVINRLSTLGFPDPVTEYKFHPVRKWRFDFAYPERKIAIECEGAVWTQGRHTRGGGYQKDCEKYNAATILGWRVLRYSQGTLDSLGNDLKSLFCGDCL